MKGANPEHTFGIQHLNQRSDDKIFNMVVKYMIKTTMS